MKKIFLAVGLAFISTSFSAQAADRLITSDKGCASLPSHAQLQAALTASVVSGGGGTDATATTGGLGFPMWVTMVNSAGRVCAVAKIGGTDPWPGSRVISAQKAYTANAFSNEKLALSTANLFTAVQPGGSLYGLQHSNPVNTLFAYAGDATRFGTNRDPMVGARVGGINVFGGGVALYDTNKKVIGAIGVSGDTSCADHQVAWKIRGALVGKGAVAAKVPGGVNTTGLLPGATGDDNIIFDLNASGVSASGFGHTAGCLNQTPPLPGNVSN
jgi:uncharacterized protein GlcG (DUF336 family)